MASKASMIPYDILRLELCSEFLAIGPSCSDVPAPPTRTVASSKYPCSEGSITPIVERLDAAKTLRTVQVASTVGKSALDVARLITAR
jgi:hypothetical protein